MRQMATTVAILSVLWGTAWAGTRDDALAGIGRCGSIADDRTWLNCVYGAVQPMRKQLGLPPAPASQTNLVPAVSATPSLIAGTGVHSANQAKRRNGFVSYLFGGNVLVTAIPLTSYRFDSHGWFTLTLANGQVWKQIDGSQLAHWDRPASQYTATISKGAVGSFNLSINNESTHYKVRRDH